MTDQETIDYLQRELTRLAIEGVEREKKLAKLEAEVEHWAQAEQDGRLVVLPCKAGDKVFSISWFVKGGRYEVRESEIKNVRYDSSDGSVMVSDGEAFRVWGKRAFATREAAKAALEAAGKE